MKAFTGLPTSTYLKVADEAKLQLSDLLKLVPALEAGLLPPYIARYRTDLSAGLDEEQLHEIQGRLQFFLELEDRRVTILSVIGQQNKLTPELRKSIETAVERREIEDLYVPFRQKRRTAADEAVENGLEPLARFLWEQQPPDADIEGIAQGYVDAEKGIAEKGILDASSALRRARHIVARWLGEGAELRGALRPMALTESRLVVSKGSRWNADASLRKKFAWLANYSSAIPKVGWRQTLALRRAVRDGALDFEIVLPENQAVTHLLDRLLHDRKSLFCLQLGAAAKEAYEEYLAPVLRSEVLQTINDRGDQEAAAVFKKNLKKTLLAPAAGPLPVIGLETSRPGGWRAAVVAADGSFLEGAIVRGGEQSGSRTQVTTVATTKQEGDSESPAADVPHDSGTSDQPVSLRDESPAATEEATDASRNGTVEASGNEAATAAEPPETPNQQSPGSGDSPQADSAADSTDSASRATGTSADVTSPETVTEAVTDEVAGAPEKYPAPPETAPTTDPESEPPTAEEAAGLESSQAPQVIAAETGSTAAKPQEEPDDDASLAPSDVSPGKPQSANKQPSANGVVVATPSGSLSDLIRKHAVGAVVISNGPGLRQTERFVRSAIRDAGAPKIFWSTVNEAGSWIYATSKNSRRETSGAEAAIRSAISLARRLQDPLSELIKIDPRLLGIGQYHAEVDPAKLRTQLRLAVQTCVHRVGVDLNTASIDLLACVAGISTRVAKRIVDYRNKKGRFANRGEFKNVPGISDRLYQQAIGFLRVHDGDNPLDSTGMHPESYDAAEKLLAAASVSAQEALQNPAALDSVNIDEIEAGDHGQERLRALVDEFRSRGRSPRKSFEAPKPAVDLIAAEDLKAGVTVEGVVANVTEFGAFVDIGADQDGLVHNSHLSEQLLKDGKAGIKAGDRISVRVLAVDKEAGRISLTTKDPAELARAKRAAGPRPNRPPSRPRSPSESGRSSEPRRRKGPGRESAVAQRLFGPDSKEIAREAAKIKKLSMDQKLSLLQSKFQTKI
jgi:transcriptional accessory protein Tex/SPT6